MGITKKWEVFEEESTKYLSKMNTNFKFLCSGSNNSREPDIKVFQCKNNKSYQHKFNIEVKLSPSQAGQIVITNDNGVFSFSEKSVNKEIPETIVIIKHLNKNYSTYSNNYPSTVNIDSGVLYSFIETQYTNKGNRWIMSADNKVISKSTLLCLVPISEIKNNFDVNATLRRKKSGPRPIPTKLLDKTKKIITDVCHGSVFSIEGKKNFVTNYTGDKVRFSDGVFLSSKGNGKYELKKLSNTNNINFMFELRLKNTCQFKGQEFNDYLDNL